MGELLGALGLAWSRLLLYPGGLFALCAGWLLWRWLGWCARLPPQPSHRLAPADLADLLPPLAALTLLPLAPARGFPFGLDLAVALGLLEWPRLRTALAGGASRDDLAHAYWPMLVAALGLGAASGSLGLSNLLTWPGTSPERWLLLASAALWLAGVPKLLDGAAMGLAARLRALGLVLVGALPLVGALAAMTAEMVPANLAGWMLPPAAGCIAALAVGGLLRLPARWRVGAVSALGVAVMILGVWAAVGP